MDGMIDLPFGNQPSIALEPVDLAAAAANSNWASLRNIGKFLALLFYAKAGAGGENITVNLQQATDNAGTGAKALTIRSAYFKKGGPAFTNSPATNDKFALSSIFGTTLTPRENPQASWATATDRVAATNSFMGLILINPRDLDMDGGFIYVRAQFTDPGATAQLGTALWLPSASAYQGSTAPSLLE